MSRFTHFKLLQLEDAETNSEQNVDHETALPDISDLGGRVQFLPQEGQIWLSGQRHLLINQQSFVSLRKQLVVALDLEKAKTILFEMGYAAGIKEAEIAQKLRIDSPQIDAFLIGPQLHALRGEVFVNPVKITANIATGEYFSELTWHNSAEAEVHVSALGSSTEPVCWMQLGYASGYTSAIMEREILFKETECTACGAPSCRIVGKPVEEWPDDTEHLQKHRAFLGVAPKSQTIEEKVGLEFLPGNVIGTSSKFLSAWKLLCQAAPHNVIIFLNGEMGVGKETFARAAHRMSPRYKRTYHSVNCSTFSKKSSTSELFGNEQTTSSQNVIGKGWLEIAEGGTLYLEQIEKLSLSAQAKLDQFLRTGCFTRVGGTHERKVDVRIICATTENLDHMVIAGDFRSDLLHSLRVYPILLPPLRDRRGDIELIATNALKRYTTNTGQLISGFTEDAMDSLLRYKFPGNIRELENIITRAAITTNTGNAIGALNMFNEVKDQSSLSLVPKLNNLGLKSANIVEKTDNQRNNPKFTLDNLTLADLEQLAIENALTDASGNISLAAKKLGVTRAKLRYRLGKRKFR